MLTTTNIFHCVYTLIAHKILEDTLTLFQSEWVGVDYAHHITNSPGFSHLSTVLTTL